MSTDSRVEAASYRASSSSSSSVWTKPMDIYRADPSEKPAPHSTFEAATSAFVHHSSGYGDGLSVFPSTTTAATTPKKPGSFMASARNQPNSPRLPLGSSSIEVLKMLDDQPGRPNADGTKSADLTTSANMPAFALNGQEWMVGNKGMSSSTYSSTSSSSSCATWSPALSSTSSSGYSSSSNTPTVLLDSKQHHQHQQQQHQQYQQYQQQHQGHHRFAQDTNYTGNIEANYKHDMTAGVTSMALPTAPSSDTSVFDLHSAELSVSDYTPFTAPASDTDGGVFNFDLSTIDVQALVDDDAFLPALSPMPNFLEDQSTFSFDLFNTTEQMLEGRSGARDTEDHSSAVERPHVSTFSSSSSNGLEDQSDEQAHEDLFGKPLSQPTSPFNAQGYLTFSPSPIRPKPNFHTLESTPSSTSGSLTSTEAVIPAQLQLPRKEKGAATSLHVNSGMTTTHSLSSIVPPLPTPAHAVPASHTAVPSSTSSTLVRAKMPSSSTTATAQFTPSRQKISNLRPVARRASSCPRRSAINKRCINDNGEIDREKLERTRSIARKSYWRRRTADLEEQDVLNQRLERLDNTKAMLRAKYHKLKQEQLALIAQLRRQWGLV